MQGSFGSVSVSIAHGASVTTGVLADFSAAKKSIFAESKERWMCFQGYFWCSVVRLMNGIDISTKEKKMIQWVFSSKARTTSISLMLLPELRSETHSYSNLLGLSVDPGACYSIVEPFIVSQKFPLL